MILNHVLTFRGIHDIDGSDSLRWLKHDRKLCLPVEAVSAFRNVMHYGMGLSQTNCYINTDPLM